MSRRLSEVLEDVKELKENTCYTSSQAIEILKLVELRGIREGLADIELALRDIQQPVESLGECVSETKHGSFLCITGNVTSYGVKHENGPIGTPIPTGPKHSRSRT